jgi:hypothetical protein
MTITPRSTPMTSKRKWRRRAKRRAVELDHLWAEYHLIRDRLRYCEENHR